MAVLAASVVLPAWTGIAMCLVGWVCAIISAIMYATHKGWGPWIIAAGILYGLALLFGNVGVIFSHAGFTG
jgi:hypothetical protein